jgi:hypothetical protein
LKKFSIKESGREYQKQEENELMENEYYFEAKNSEVCIWIEQGSSIQIKAITKTNDPVELSVEVALEIAEVLRKFASRI